MTSLALGLRVLLYALDDYLIRWRWIGAGVALPAVAWGVAIASIIVDPSGAWTWFLD